MKKVVLNCGVQGFSLSREAVLKILERKGIEVQEIESRNRSNFTIYTANEKYYSFSFNNERDDEDVVAVVEELGAEANGDCADLSIKEYDDDNFEYTIIDDCGEEYLELTPVVSEKRLTECKSTSEIIEYLKSIDIKVKER